MFQGKTMTPRMNDKFYHLSFKIYGFTSQKISAIYISFISKNPVLFLTVSHILQYHSKISTILAHDHQKFNISQTRKGIFFCNMQADLVHRFSLSILKGRAEGNGEKSLNLKYIQQVLDYVCMCVLRDFTFEVMLGGWVRCQDEYRWGSFVFLLSD